MKKKTFVVILVSIIIVSIIMICFIPRIRVKLFVNCYHLDIEESLSNGNGAPSNETLLFGNKSVNA